jgi:hypothetical protein
MYYASLSHENDVRNAIFSKGESVRMEVETKYQPMVKDYAALKKRDAANNAKISALEARVEQLCNMLNSRNN